MGTAVKGLEGELAVGEKGLSIGGDLERRVVEARLLGGTLGSREGGFS